MTLNRISQTILIVVCIMGVCPSSTIAQTKAVTAHGDTVVLLDNGQWQFIENYEAFIADTIPDSIPTNTTPFFKPDDANKVVKHMGGDYEVWYNDQNWEPADPELVNPQATHVFASKNNEAYAMLIHEKIKMPIDVLMSIAVANVQKVAPDSKVLFSEYRTVNNQQVLHTAVSGTVQGITFKYHYYFAANENGSTQFIGFTGSNLYDDLKSEFNDLLNGLILK